MIFEEKIIALENGRQCILRSPDIDDAEQLLDYLKKISSETDFLIRYPEEITISIEDEKKFIQSIRESSRNIMVLALVDDRIIGTSSINCISESSKLIHRGTLGIAILKELWYFGVGTIMMSEILDQAKYAGYEQVELEVVSANLRAIKLYQKYGFEIYGSRKNGLKLKDGSYYAEYLMIKEL